eukprot:scaffold20902_cov67-Skeletonema_dohrnii-CCMP3373.AAC.2
METYFSFLLGASVSLVFAAILLYDHDQRKSAGDNYHSNSKNSDGETGDMPCACCGISELDDVTLKKCTACQSARNCSDKCRETHRPQHKKACEKRAAEVLRDEMLFKHPKSTHLGDCPICLLLIPYDMYYPTIMSCCSKIMCNGCEVVNKKRETEERLDHRCLFCRHPEPKSQEEYDQNFMKRIEANDPVAMLFMATRKNDNTFEYLTKAAELDDAEAHYQLSNLYGSAGMDAKIKTHHLEQAAIGGHPIARYHLALDEKNSGRMERAMKHFSIAANHGHEPSLKQLKEGYAEGYISKEDFAAALRAYQDTAGDMKSQKTAETQAIQEHLRETAERVQQWPPDILEAVITMIHQAPNFDESR